MVQQEAVIDDRKLSNIRAEYWFRITVLILRSRGTKAFDTDLQVAPPQFTSRRPIFMLLMRREGRHIAICDHSRSASACVQGWRVLTSFDNHRLWLRKAVRNESG